MNQSQDQFDMTQKEIANALRMNRSTVNYYERQALEKLKASLEAKGFKASDFLEVK